MRSLSLVFKLVSEIDKYHKLNILMLLGIALLNAFFEVLAVISVGGLIFGLSNSIPILENNILDDVPPAALGFIIVLAGIMKLVQIYSFNSYIFRVNWLLSTGLLRSWFHNSGAHLIYSETDVLAKNVITESQNFCVKVLRIYLNLGSAIIVMTAMGLFLISISNISLLVGVVAFLVFALIAFRPVLKFVKRNGKIRDASLLARYQLLSTFEKGWREVIVEGKVKPSIEQFSFETENYSRSLKWQTIIENAPRPVMEILVVLVFIALSLVETQSGFILTAVATMFAAAAYRALPYVTQIYRASFEANYYNSVILSLLHGLRKLQKEDRERINLQHFDGIAIENLGFKFGEISIVSKVNCNILPGDKVVLYGASGSGKTTLLNLLCGVLIPTEGACKVVDDGTVYTPDRLAFGLCGQHPVLEKAHVNALKQKHMQNQLKAKELICDLIRFFDGCDISLDSLSGGQKQRLSFVYLLNSDFPVLFLDEPGASQDKSFKEAVYNAIDQTEKTVICVSHDTEYLKMFNKIITLN